MALADQMVVMNQGRHRAGRQPARGLRASPRPNSSPASSAATTSSTRRPAASRCAPTGCGAWPRCRGQPARSSRSPRSNTRARRCCGVHPGRRRCRADADARLDRRAAGCRIPRRAARARPARLRCAAAGPRAGRMPVSPPPSPLPEPSFAMSADLDPQIVLSRRTDKTRPNCSAAASCGRCRRGVAPPAWFPFVHAQEKITLRYLGTAVNQDKAIAEKFEADTGIKIQYIPVTTDEVTKRAVTAPNSLRPDRHRVLQPEEDHPDRQPARHRRQAHQERRQDHPACSPRARWPARRSATRAPAPKKVMYLP